MSVPRVLVTVGSDHHLFTRLIDWLDSWLEEHPDALDLVTQHGPARAPRSGIAFAFMPHDLLLAELDECDLVLTQGGPMGIVEATRTGRRPIVVPRLRLLDEVVDDHQVAFCRQLAAVGALVLAESEQALHAALDRAVADPASFRFEPADIRGETAASVRRFADVVAALPSRRGLLRRGGRHTTIMSARG